MRMNIAMNNPMRRAISCCALGNLLTKIEMKMMLSMPSTNSSKVKVAKATHIWGSVSSSMMGLNFF